MTWRDKLEIGLKEDAPFRKDNLPTFQVRGPEVPAGPGRSSVVVASRTDPTGPAEAAEVAEAIEAAEAAEPAEPAEAAGTEAVADPTASSAMTDEGAPVRKPRRPRKPR